MAASKNLTPSQRQTRSRKGSYASWANTKDRTARTEPGRQGLFRKFENRVDPERKMSPEERAKAAESAYKAYFTGLSFLAGKARRRRAAERKEKQAGSDG